MGVLRSRILRTLQSFPNAAQSNLLLPPAPDAGASPELPAAEPCGRVQKEAPPPQEAAVADGVPETAQIVSDGGDKENVSPEDTTTKARAFLRWPATAGRTSPRRRSSTRSSSPNSAAPSTPTRRPSRRLSAATKTTSRAAARRRGRASRRIRWSRSRGGARPAASARRCSTPRRSAACARRSRTARACAACSRASTSPSSSATSPCTRPTGTSSGLRELLCSDGEAGFPVPPRLFVDGRYIGGADEVVALHERSHLRPVLRRAPRRGAGEGPCRVCGGAWFVVCGGCSGSHWLHDSNAGGGGAATPTARVPCTACNENGLVPCPLCS